MSNRLNVYNQILIALGQRELESLRQKNSGRRTIDTIWTPSLRYCLSRGQWNFATRAVAVTADATPVPGFGYSNAFAKPADWVRTAGLCTDERFNQPLTQYHDEQSYWFADVETIYVRYVSDNDSYGNNLELWPTTFERYVVAHLTAELYIRFASGNGQPSSPQALVALRAIERDRLREAMSEDAMNQPPAFPPTGSWVRARLGNRSNASRWNGGFR